MTPRFILVMVLAALAAAFAVMLWGQAYGETIPEWIHRTNPSCCPHESCVPVQARPVPAGWIVYDGEYEYPYFGRPLPSPGATYACIENGMVRCLYLQGGTA